MLELLELGGERAVGELERPLLGPLGTRLAALGR